MDWRFEWAIIGFSNLTSHDLWLLNLIPVMGFGNRIQNLHMDNRLVQQRSMPRLLVAEPDTGHGVRQPIEMYNKKFAYWLIFFLFWNWPRCWSAAILSWKFPLIHRPLPMWTLQRRRGPGSRGWTSSTSWPCNRIRKDSIKCRSPSGLYK